MLFIVLPAFNEAEALPKLVADLELVCQDYPYQIIIVNDGSSDRTQEIACQLTQTNPAIHVINHDQNRGLGAALFSGFIKALDLQRSVHHRENAENIPDVVVTMDCDNTHPPDRIPLLLNCIQQGADLAIASRYVPGGRQIGLRWLRKFLSRCAGLLMGTVFPIPGVRDYSCGYRAYRLGVLERALNLYGMQFIQSKNFAAMVEILVKLAPLCREIREIPLILHYERKSGQSKMKIFQTIWGYFRLIYRLKWETRGSMT